MGEDIFMLEILRCIYGFVLQAVNDLRNQITKEKLNISLITVEGFSQYTKTHPRVQLENLKVR